MKEFVSLTIVTMKRGKKVFSCKRSLREKKCFIKNKKLPEKKLS